MTKSTGQIFFIIIDISLITICSLLFYLIQPMTTQKVIYVPQGGIGRIITQLGIHNSEIYVPLDKALLSVMGRPQTGWIDMGRQRLSKADFLYNLSHAKAALRPITLIPGETSYIFLQQLSSELNLSAGELQKHYRELSPLEDGWIVPNTYNVPIGIDAKSLITHLINTSKRSHEALSNELLGEFDEREWQKLLVIASIIQKESASVEEMPLVSSVIHNRLKINMRLQMDGTLNYGRFSHVRVTSQRIKEDNSLYNTYLYKGTPPNPVCAVSQEAIKAAANPAMSDYLYFVKGDDGRHIFSRTYQEHLNNIKK
jgi:UPF0755 protein